MRFRDITNQPQSSDDLDKILFLLVSLIVKKIEKRQSFSGVVAAAVVSPDFPVFVSLSQKLNDKTVHAERTAVTRTATELVWKRWSLEGESWRVKSEVFK
jgi:hypothetical protein